MKLGHLGLAFGLWFVGGCTGESHPPSSVNTVADSRLNDEKAEPDEGLLRKLFAKGDVQEIVHALNRVKSLRPNRQLLPFLVAVWNGEVTSQNKVTSEPRIRLEIADVLLQMERNGAQGLNADQYSDYARRHVGSEDSQIQRQAILVLAIANKPQDVGTFRRIIVDTHSPNYRAAAIGIVENCSVDEATMFEIAKGLPSERAKFLISTWEQSSAIRVCR